MDDSYDSSDGSYTSTDSDSGDYIFNRSRGRTRHEDSQKHRYHRKKRNNGYKSPNSSDDKRSLSPYSCGQFTKYKKKKYKKKKTKGSQKKINSIGDQKQKASIITTGSTCQTDSNELQTSPFRI